MILPNLKPYKGIFIYGFLLMLIFYSNHSHSQNVKKALKIRLVSHEGDIEQDCAFNEMMKKIIQETPLREKYDHVHYEKSGYTDPVENLGEDVIESFPPTKFIMTKTKLDSMNKGSIIPIFIVQKEGRDHYPCYFVKSKNSKIHSLEEDFKKIKKLYFVTVNSTSGYTKPLDYLVRKGLITEPCTCSVKARYKNISIFFKDSHPAIKEQLQKEGEDYSVGAIYNLDTTVRELRRYDDVPQDVIFISQNLVEYKDSIINWFKKSINDPSRKNLFVTSSQRITGLTDYQDENHDPLYNELLMLKNKVDQCEARNCKGEQTIFNWFIENKNDILVHSLFFILGIIVSIIGYLIGKKKKPSTT